MKAIVRTSLEPGCMEIQERPIPEIAEDEVLIKVKAVGVCGTDLHIYNGNVVTGTDVVIGHDSFSFRCRLNGRCKLCAVPSGLPV